MRMNNDLEVNRSNEKDVHMAVSIIINSQENSIYSTNDTSNQQSRLVLSMLMVN